MKRVLPRIKAVDDRELPQWIMPSAHAAYAPATRTIWIATRRPLLRVARDLLHELVHHWIEVLTSSPKLHYAWDRWETITIMNLSALKNWLRGRRAFEAVPPAVGKLAVDYARKHLHFTKPLISDFEKQPDQSWVVTVTSDGREVAVTVDRNRSVVGTN